MNRKEFFNKFQGLKGAKFIGIRNYVSTSTGEISNVVVNVNVSYENAVKFDLESLQAIESNDLEIIGKSKGLDLEQVKKAHAELIISFTNKVEGIETNQSKGQKDAYINLGKGLRLHKDTLNLYVWGFVQSKEIVKEGEYKKVNSSDKTIAKRVIEKQFCKSAKFRNYNIGSLESIKVDRSEFVLQG